MLGEGDREHDRMKRTTARRSSESLSLEELAQQQGVSSIDDLQEGAKLWPVDDDT